MSRLVKKIGDGVWQGVASGRYYYHHDIGGAEALEAQEEKKIQAIGQRAATAARGSGFKNPHPKGSAAATRYEAELESLSNVQAANAQEAQRQYLDFLHRHPEYQSTPSNDAQMIDYFLEHGVHTVTLNGEQFPLCIDAEMWEQAFNTKFSRGFLTVNQKVLDGIELAEAKDRAKEQLANQLTEEDYYAMDGDKFFGLRNQAG